MRRASLLVWLAVHLLAILAAGIVGYALLRITVEMRAWGM